jgi:hypothetical protein
MTGERALIAMRRNGRNPHGVWVTDSDDTYARTTAREWPMHRFEKRGQPDHHAAHIRMDANDIPEALDLRCVVGLTCHVATERGATRFNRIFDALIAAGAAVVVGVHDDQVRMHPQPGALHG